jgi:hypothetical protein
MNARNSLLGLASAVTTFLLVGAATIATLSGQYGDSPGIGIIAVFVGVVAGLLVGGGVAFAAGRLTGLARAAVVAYGTFGVTYLAVAGLSYVNVPGADDVFTFPVHLAVSLAFAAAAAAFVGRGSPPGTRPSV